jgi:hypothetical protein
VHKKALGVLREKEKSKRGKYEERAELMGSTFAPLVCSIYGTLAPEAAKILTILVGSLDEENQEKRSTGKLLRVALQVAILKATSLCLRARAMEAPPQAIAHEELESDCTAGLADARPISEDEAVSEGNSGA